MASGLRYFHAWLWKNRNFLGACWGPWFMRPQSSEVRGLACSASARARCVSPRTFSAPRAECGFRHLPPGLWTAREKVLQSLTDECTCPGHSLGYPLLLPSLQARAAWQQGYVLRKPLLGDFVVCSHRGLRLPGPRWDSLLHTRARGRPPS